MYICSCFVAGKPHSAFLHISLEGWDVDEDQRRLAFLEEAVDDIPASEGPQLVIARRCNGRKPAQSVLDLRVLVLVRERRCHEIDKLHYEISGLYSPFGLVFELVYNVRNTNLLSVLSGRGQVALVGDTGSQRFVLGEVVLDLVRLLPELAGDDSRTARMLLTLRYDGELVFLLERRHSCDLH